MFSNSPTNNSNISPTTASIGSLSIFKTPVIELVNYGINDIIDLGTSSVTFAVLGFSFVTRTATINTNNYFGIYTLGNYTTNDFSIHGLLLGPVAGATVASSAIIPGYFPETFILNAGDNFGLTVTDEQVGFSELQVKVVINGYVL